MLLLTLQIKNSDLKIVAASALPLTIKVALFMLFVKLKTRADKNDNNNNIENFHLKTYQGNFASHHTRTAMLFSFLHDPVLKNTTKCLVTF